MRPSSRSIAWEARRNDSAASSSSPISSIACRTASAAASSARRSRSRLTSGASVPTTTNDVYFDASGLGTCTVDTNPKILSLNMTSGYTGALAFGTNTVTVAGSADLRSGGTFTGSSGPTQIKAQGQQLSFEPIQRLAAKGEAVYKIRVRGSVAGDQRFSVQLTCDQVRTPISKDESTKFYKE